MAIVITGKSLRMVRNSGKVATDHPGKKVGQTVIGKPVTIAGSDLVKYTGVSDAMADSIRAESNPAKRDALLTNVTGQKLDGGRTAINRDVFDAFISGFVAEVAADPADPTDDERKAARAALRSWFDGGLVVLPTVAESEEDALSWAFGIADDEDDEDDEDGDDA